MSCIECFYSSRNYGKCGERIDLQGNPINRKDLQRYRSQDKREAFSPCGTCLCNNFTLVIHGQFHKDNDQWYVIGDDGSEYSLSDGISLQDNMVGLRASVGINGGMVTCLVPDRM